MEALTLGEFVAERGRRLTLDAGRVLFRQGDASTSVYSCVSGRIDLSLTAPSGRELMVAVVEAGQVFGELAAIDGAMRSATATASGPTVVAQMSSDEFLAGLESAPRLAVAMLRTMAAHMRRTTERIAARSSENTTERVAHLLIEFAGRFGRYAGRTAPVVLAITQEELAMWVGTTREATSRSLGELRATGSLSTGRGSITVVDVEALAAYARTLSR